MGGPGGLDRARPLEVLQRYARVGLRGIGEMEGAVFLRASGEVRPSNLRGVQPRPLPVMSAMTCLVGDYGMPGMDSLSEKLVLKSGGGTIASWAPTGLSVNPLSMSLNRGFFKALFQDGKKVLGDAIRSAQSDYMASGGARYTLEIYNLLGDPALRVK